MFRPFASWPALIPLLMAGVVQAEEASATPADPQAAVAQTQDVMVAEPQPQPAQTSLPEAGVQEHAAADRLPTAQPAGFLKRHPVSMPKMTMPKPDWASWKPTTVYGGGGIFNDMVSVNAVALTGKGIFYARVGRFMDSNLSTAINGGWRRPITGTVSTNGYSGGIFFGQIMADSFNGEPYNRLGVGADVTYQWVNQHTLKSFGVGIGVGQEKTGPKVAKKRAKPDAFFSYSVSLKIF